jgi:nucleotide-binding universal stress UspA family protein
MNSQTPGPSLARFGMKAERLLLPIDLAKCPPEAFLLANDLVPPFKGEIVLLYVIDRQTNSVTFRGRGPAFRRAESLLERVGSEYVRPTVEVSVRVRVGIPHEEILAEATTSDVDLILMPTFTPSIWSRWFGVRCGDTARNLISEAACRVLVADMRTHFNCFRRLPRDNPEDRWAA